MRRQDWVEYKLSKEFIEWHRVHVPVCLAGKQIRSKFELSAGIEGRERGGGERRGGLKGWNTFLEDQAMCSE